MKNKTKFIKMYKKLPEEARRSLVLYYYDKPMSLNVIYYEVLGNTELGKKCLIELGYEDNPQSNNGEHQGDSQGTAETNDEVLGHIGGEVVTSSSVDTLNRKNTLKGDVFSDGERKGCEKVFETDLIHKDGSKDTLVCKCGGEDGLCEDCSSNHGGTQ